MSDTRNPRAEATSLLPAGFEARVLEPSPPASSDPQWYADDPTDPAGDEAEIVTPIDGEGKSWDQIAAEVPELRPYAADHWLSPLHGLEPLPDRFRRTREALHQVAFFAIAPKRYQSTGKLGLRYTYRGFGTPFFDDDQQVRVESGALVYQRGSDVVVEQPTTTAEACHLLEIPYRDEWYQTFHDPPEPVGPNEHLEIDTSAATALGDWFGFATLVLERARRFPDAVEVTRVQLWPEHFDAAVEMGAQDHGARASYGGSPGDADHPEPYMYVAAWEEVDRADPFWNDPAFNGASLSYSNLVESEDPVTAALAFLGEGHRRLNGS